MKSPRKSRRVSQSPQPISLSPGPNFPISWLLVCENEASKLIYQNITAVGSIGADLRFVCLPARI